MQADRTIPPPQPIDAPRVLAIRDRWALRDGLRSISSINRVARCSIYKRPDKLVSIRRSDIGRASFGGVETCGSIWACPNCSGRIRQQRAVDVGEAGTRWLSTNEAPARQTDLHGIEFLTFTMAHKRADRLDSSIRSLLWAFRRLQQGGIWRAAREAGYLAGFVRATEVTRSETNGWHPHLHLAVFTQGVQLGAALRERVRASLEREFVAILRSIGRTANLDRALDWRPAFAGGAAGLGWYMCKVQDGTGNARPLGQELTRGDLKRGRKTSRTPFEILTDAVSNGRVMAIVQSADEYAGSDVGLWHEYEQATRGLHAIQWSRGLSKLVGLLPELSDEQLASTDDDELVHNFTRDDWSMVVRLQLRGAVLVAAEHGGSLAVARYLARVRRRPVERVTYRVDRRTGEIR